MPNCCRALTAECLACTEGISVLEFCNKRENRNVVGCDRVLDFLQTARKLDPPQRSLVKKSCDDSRMYTFGFTL